MQTILYHGWYINVDYGLGTLTSDEITSNGMRLAQLLYNMGWTENCIAGILGNVHGESGMNPGSTEQPRPWGDYLPDNDEVLQTSYLRGMGFTQWTPGRTKLVQWADDLDLLWYDGNTQVKRLKWECDNGEQMGGWQWFIHNTGDPADLAEYFLRQYERPSPEQIEESLPIRRAYGTMWYGRIHGKLKNSLRLMMISKQSRDRKVMKPRCQRM